MPTFGLDDRQLNGAINYFGAIANTVGPFQTHELVPVSNTLGVGKQLFDLLKCQQCHVLGAIPKDQPTANLAPDLRMAHDRLQPDWIRGVAQAAVRHRARHAHARVLAGLSEIGLSAGRTSTRKAQIRAIRDYLMTLRGGPSPRGTGGAVTAN